MPYRTKEEPLDFKNALQKEMEVVCGKTVDGNRIIDEDHRDRLSGLAFSGGGIRSATFNLGVLQALAGMSLLDKFDYLSTVG